MKIGIIVCDKLDPVLSQQFGEFADMIMATLSPHGQFEYQQYDAFQQNLPKQNDDCQGYIITGSTHDAYSDQPWVHNLIEWIKYCDQIRKPLVGICFGHQVISIALGGKVEKSNKGWGLGVSENQVHQHPTWMTPNKTQLNLLVSHQDQVTELPPSTQLISSSDFCPYYMFSKGQHILTVQGHPEFSVEFEQKLLDKKRDLISDELYEKAKLSLQTEPDSSVVMKWFAEFFIQSKN
ncbi:gamma-glutamyl-gamma-aminobutyrate hydrolase family protein [Vibrio sp. TH_r3]|uniref:glutamine amidotransferase-related protein n=1 Tax=Vibrio sp. TH_r3 TaxID=3082084 RepID=UPI0029553E85|nr:gamma-glutamyl-gamma-aminobutyrate hydrolase family protein [Vibrio sp. TH_r3]MDV7103652.1 gamma-glutamyl-gamma-aminobutyrate hydrolase family protein [Vibrio sp. TH_r3]